LYHSLYEWFNPLYLEDAKFSPPKTQFYIDQVLMPQLVDIVSTYQPEIIWADGDWDQNSEYWNSTSFLAWLYNDSPVKDTVIVNDRWGNDCRGVNGGFFTCYDGYVSFSQKHKWEDSATVGTSYGYNRHETLSEFSTSCEVVQTLVEVVSLGGNLILGVGPTRDGSIPIIMEERLRDLGNWLKINGEGIYKTKPWRVHNDTRNLDVWFTENSKNPDTIYCFFFYNWPIDNVLSLYHPRPETNTTITLFSQTNFNNLSWSFKESTLIIQLPSLTLGLAQQMVWGLQLSNTL